MRREVLRLLPSPRHATRLCRTLNDGGPDGALTGRAGLRKTREAVAAGGVGPSWLGTARFSGNERGRGEQDPALIRSARRVRRAPATAAATAPARGGTCKPLAPTLEQRPKTIRVTPADRAKFILEQLHLVA